ncbi:MAG: hypothetical protein IJ551_09970 [Prevotella sp.]|nr:hypothetical protein [Prevotella sp.]
MPVAHRGEGGTGTATMTTATTEKEAKKKATATYIYKWWCEMKEALATMERTPRPWPYI